MPKINPQYPDVSWPMKEGTIGVVGVAPWATLDFCRKIYELCPASKDWHYPRILIDANSKIPSRGRHIELGEVDPSPFIKETIHELAVAGATIAVVPCNTAHILYSRWAENAEIPIINIIDATVSSIPQNTGMTVAILGSQYLSESGLFQRYLIGVGHNPYNISSTQQVTVSYCIDQLKQHPYPSAVVLEQMSKLSESLHDSGVEIAILACTELSILFAEPIWGNLIIADSNSELARISLRTIGINAE